MAVKYIYRVDDITEDMNWDMFERHISLFKRYNVKPLLGVVPNNKDHILKVDKCNPGFWTRVRELQEKQIVEISQHGYEHLHESKGESILKAKYGYAVKSEFSGLDYKAQCEKLRKGREILENNGVCTNIFMAPGHSFDRTTIMALKELGFKYITDGIGLSPYYIDDIKLLPVQYGRPRNFIMPFGVITICLHINRCTQEDIDKLEKHIIINKKNIIAFSEAIHYKENKLLNKLFGSAYLCLRYIKAKFIY